MGDLSTNSNVAIENIGKYFEVDKITEIVNRNQYKIVAIQVPNHLLGYISDVEYELKRACGDANFFILADETYGNCCVDIITAKHYIPQLLIHYGNACFNHHNATYPILYSFNGGNGDVDLRRLKSAIDQRGGETRPFIVFYDLSYDGCCGQIESVFGNDKNVIAHPICNSMILIEPTCQLVQNSANTSCGGGGNPGCCSSALTAELQEMDLNAHSNDDMMILCGRKLPKKILSKDNIANYDILLLTRNNPVDDRFQHNLSITFPHNKLHIYDGSLVDEPFFHTVDSMSNVKHLIKRSKFVGEVDKATTIGLLLYGPAVKGLMTLGQNLKQIITSFGKKCVNVSIGRITVAKLANFLQVDLWVSLSCYNNIYVDNTELYKPVITPIELIHGLIQNCADYETINQFQLPFANCTLVDISAYLDEHKGAIMALSPLYDESFISTETGAASSSIVWTGLESQNNATIISDVEQGKKGTAAQYDNDIYLT